MLRGGGIDNNVAGIRIAQYEQQAVDVKTRLQSIRVLAAVERAYWGLYVAWGELDVRLQQYENAADNLAMVKKRVAAGLTAAVEINRAEIGVAERMEGLIVTETTLKIRERQLKLFLNDPGLNLDSSTLLVPDSTPTLVEFKFDREQLAQRALAGRLELLELELKLAADLTKIDYLRNQTLPMFMLDYSYGTLGRSTSSFGGAFDQAIGDDYSDWSVGVRMEMPLTNELRRAQLDRAVQERLQRLTTQQLRELSVRREIYDALDQVGQNWQRILAARQNVRWDHARDGHIVFRRRFRPGDQWRFSDWSVGVRMEMPLTNELRRAQLDRAVQERLQRLTTQQLRELSVRREIYDALDQVAQNWQRILAARQNVLLAGLNYDAELKQFSEGLRTMTEVLETLTRLGEAQLREVRAIGDYQVSIIDLAFATGTLLGHSRIGWDNSSVGSH